MIISLPFLPPSVNQIFYTDFKNKTRHKSKRYRDFLSQMDYYLPAQEKNLLKGDLSVEINFYFPDKRKRDIDNCVKAVLDGLKYYSLIGDDSQIQTLHLEKYYRKNNPETVIEIKRLDSQE